MKRTTWVLGTLAFLAAVGVRPNSQMPASHSTIEMNGVTPAMKLQVPVEGFMTALNGKIESNCCVSLLAFHSPSAPTPQANELRKTST